MKLTSVTINTQEKILRALEFSIYTGKAECQRLVSLLEITSETVSQVVLLLMPWLPGKMNSDSREQILQKILDLNIDVWMNPRLSIVEPHDSNQLKQWWAVSALERPSEKQYLINEVLIQKVPSHLEFLTHACHRYLDRDDDWMHTPFLNDAERGKVRKVLEVCRAA